MLNISEKLHNAQPKYKTKNTREKVPKLQGFILAYYWSLFFILKKSSTYYHSNNTNIDVCRDSVLWISDFLYFTCALHAVTSLVWNPVKEHKQGRLL